MLYEVITAVLPGKVARKSKDERDLGELRGLEGEDAEGQPPLGTSPDLADEEDHQENSDNSYNFV